MTSIIVFLVALVGIGVTHAIRVRPRRTPDWLPCPNLPCTNRLPRRGMWSRATGEWAVEECPVCGAAIQYRSGIEKSAALSSTDCYIRVVAVKSAQE